MEVPFSFPTYSVWRLKIIQIFLMPSYIIWPILKDRNTIRHAQIIYRAKLGYSKWSPTDGLVQYCSFSIANALDILQSCSKPQCHEDPCRKFMKQKSWESMYSTMMMSWNRHTFCIIYPLWRNPPTNQCSLSWSEIPWCSGDITVNGNGPSNEMERHLIM